MSSWAQLVHKFVVVASYIGCLLIEFAFLAIATPANLGIHFTIVIHLLSYLLAIVSHHFESGFPAGTLYLPVPVPETVILPTQVVVFLQERVIPFVVHSMPYMPQQFLALPAYLSDDLPGRDPSYKLFQWNFSHKPSHGKPP